MTFYSLYRYLGLSRELLRLENLVNFANLSVPLEFKQGEFQESLDRIRDRYSPSYDGFPTDLVGDFRATLFERESALSPDGVRDFSFPLPMIERGGRLHTSNDDSDGEMGDSDADNSPGRSMSNKTEAKNAPGHGSHSRLSSEDDEDELRLKQGCFDLIMEYIGYSPLSSPHSATPPSVSSKSSAVASKSLFARLDAKDLSDMMSSPQRRGSSSIYPRRYSMDSATDDDLTSTTGSISQSLTMDPFQEIQIRHFSADEILIGEGIYITLHVLFR